jgi:hypothetical protein
MPEPDQPQGHLFKVAFFHAAHPSAIDAHFAMTN